MATIHNSCENVTGCINKKQPCGDTTEHLGLGDSRGSPFVGRLTARKSKKLHSESEERC